MRGYLTIITAATILLSATVRAEDPSVPAEDTNGSASAAVEVVDDQATAIKPPAEFTNQFCTYGPMARRIEVQYQGSAKVPCQVIYAKRESDDSEWQSQAAWNSQNQIGYCEARAAEFLNKHQNWGWNCQAQESASAE